MQNRPSGARRRPPLGAVLAVRTVLSPVLRALWRPRLEGAEYRPAGPCFVYGNHSNYLDPFTTNLFLGRDVTAGIMTFEFLRKGLFARSMRNIGILPTRPDRMEPQLIREVYRMLDQGRSILIYPEAGRRWDGLPMPWVSTVARLFIRAGVPLHPVIVEGSYVGWPRWAKYPRPARITVRFLPPIELDDSVPYAGALRRMSEPIQFDESRPPGRTKPRWAFRPACGIETVLYRNPFTGDLNDVHSPDGYRVLTRSGTHTWRMLPDSSLRDEKTGEVMTVADLYPRIRSMPLKRDREGALLRSPVDLLIENPTNGMLERRGRVDALLYDDALRLEEPAHQWHIPLESIRSVGVQRSWKLQLGHPTGLHQLEFRYGGSPLQWEDAIALLNG